MPVAVVTEEKVRKDLKTLEGGFVVIRQMTYGERLLRQSKTGKMKVSAGKGKEFEGEMDMGSFVREFAYWDFANLIIEHNLELKPGELLNLKNPTHVDLLRGDVGEEIGTYIDQINSFEDVEEGN